jgi:hypothetical protein
MEGKFLLLKFKTEQESLNYLHQLVKHTIEAISFLALLIDYRFPSLLSK